MSVKFPEGLSEKDIELINIQCKNQNAVSEEQLLGFAKAYNEAKEFAQDLEKINTITEVQVYDMIKHFGRLVEPKKNKNGFRKVPARFSATNFAVKPGLVPQALLSLCFFFHDIEPLEFYTEFENIHPFNDGNGRVGDLMWKILMTKKTGHWPDELPPDVFGG